MMEVEATTLNLHTPEWDNTPAMPDAAEVDAFTQALFGQQAHSPEEVVAGNLQQKSQSIGHAIEDARASVELLNNPDAMLEAQSALKNATVEVDLIAKTAGLLSQGVNKLVSMQ